MSSFSSSCPCARGHCPVSSDVFEASARERCKENRTDTIAVAQTQNIPENEVLVYNRDFELLNGQSVIHELSSS